MSSDWLSPSAVVRAELPPAADDRFDGVPVQRVAVPVVPAAHAVPRRLDPVALRLVALEVEVAQLREELARLRLDEAAS